MDKEVLKIQAGLNFFFKKIAILAKFTNSGDYENIINFERLFCDGLIGPKTKQTIEEFKVILPEVKYKSEENKFNAGDLFDANEYYCKVNSDFTYISQRESKYPNQLCSVACLAMILDGFGFDITVDELNNFIDTDNDLAAAAVAMGFKKYVELKKIEQITAIMVLVLEVFGINAEMKYLNKFEILDIMCLKQNTLSRKRIIFATNFTQSGHYVVGNYAFKKFANANDFNISVFDPFGDYTKKYKNADGRNFFDFETFLQFLKTDGYKDKYRCIIIN